MGRNLPLRPSPLLFALVLPLLVAGVVATTLLLAGSGRSFAQEPLPEPAFVTLLNLTPRFQTVDIDRRLDSGETDGLTRIAVQPDQPETFVIDAGAVPEDFTATCLSCRAADFSVAAGQRLVVLLVGIEQRALVRSDLHVVNESGARQRGAVRTGATIGDGRSLLPFDLRDGESARVGLRLRDGPIDLNLTCPACDPQQIRIGNGVDLEVVIR